jgi:hypothetical protein
VRVVAVLGDRTEFGSRTVLTVLARPGSWAQVSAAVLGGRRASRLTPRLTAVAPPQPTELNALRSLALGNPHGY